MKNLKWMSFIISIAVISVFSLTQIGCYTVLWSPDQSYTPQQPQSENGYYDNTYYGEYYSYYDVPWWYNVPSIHAYKSSGQTGGNNKSVQSIRDNAGDRGQPARLNIPTFSPTEVETTTRSGSTGNSNVESSNSRNTTEAGSRNTSGSDNTRSSNNNNNSTRNNNGDRNNGGRH